MCRPVEYPRDVSKKIPWTYLEYEMELISTQNISLKHFLEVTRLQMTNEKIRSGIMQC